jgi:hypothetical protein
MLSDMIRAVGGVVAVVCDVRSVLVGTVDGGLWDTVAVVTYPSMSVLANMRSHPMYATMDMHREAGISGELVMTAQPSKL